jgi:hypothetical protein
MRNYRSAVLIQMSFKDNQEEDMEAGKEERVIELDLFIESPGLAGLILDYFSVV